MSPYFILSFARPALERRVQSLSSRGLTRLAAEVRRLRPLVGGDSVSLKTVLRLASIPLSNVTRLALQALSDFARAERGLQQRIQLLEDFPLVVRAVRRRARELASCPWRCLWAQVRGGWRVVIWERDRRRADITLAQQARPAAIFAKTLAALGATDVVIEHYSRVSASLRRACEKAGIAVVRAARVPHALAELTLCGRAR